MSALTKIILIVLVHVLSTTFAVRQPVWISKCCNKDEILKSDSTCLRNGSSTWDIRIYNARKSKFEKFQSLPDHWKIKENTKPNCVKPTRLTYQNLNNFPILNGSFFSVEYDKVFDPEHFCLDYESALVCMQPQPISYPYIKKCCGDNAIFSETKNTCIHFPNDSYKIDIGQDKTLGAGFPMCLDRMQVVAELHKSKILSNGSMLVDNRILLPAGNYCLDLKHVLEHKAKILPNGSLLVDTRILLPAGNYCLEHVLEHTGRSASVITCSDYLPSEVRIEATPRQNQSTEADPRLTIYPSGLAISAIFLAATLAAGSLLPASHHVLHWRCQTNHVACLLLGDVLLCITHLSKNIDYIPCFSIAVSMHFLFLAGFFWLNTMCFNIWWTFRDLRPQSTEKSQERIRLRLYEAYAWGIPLLIIIISAALDLSYNPSIDVVKPTFLESNSCWFYARLTDESSINVLRPKFAENKCWFDGDMEILTFFYGPIGTLLFINLLLFILTARELTCGLWKRELVKSTTERAALGRVCMKLVVVMGITWIADIISWAVGGPHELWYVTDLINSLHGVFIFIVVGCQPQVLSAVKRIWCLRKHRQNATAGTTLNHHSSSSQGPPSMGDTLTNTNSITNGTTKCVPLETSC